MLKSRLLINTTILSEMVKNVSITRFYIRGKKKCFLLTSTTKLVLGGCQMVAMWLLKCSDWLLKRCCAVAGGSNWLLVLC